MSLAFVALCRGGGERKFKAQIFQSTVVAIVVWDSKENWLVDFLKKDATINSEQFVQTLKKLKQRIRRVRQNRKINQVLLHDNAGPHTGRCTRKAIATMEWTLLPCHPYSLDLAPFGFNPFGPERCTPRTPFADDVDLKHNVRHFSKEFHATGLDPLTKSWKICVVNLGDFVENNLNSVKEVPRISANVIIILNCSF